MKIVNLTPHAIVVGTETFSPSGLIARVEMTGTASGELNGFPVRVLAPAGNNLPVVKADTVYLVSGLVLTAAKLLGRVDCIAPDTDKGIRNEKGHIVSVPGFVR